MLILQIIIPYQLFYLSPTLHHEWINCVFIITLVFLTRLRKNRQNVGKGMMTHIEKVKVSPTLLRTICFVKTKTIFLQLISSQPVSHTINN